MPDRFKTTRATISGIFSTSTLAFVSMLISGFPGLHPPAHSPTRRFQKMASVSIFFLDLCHCYVRQSIIMAIQILEIVCVVGNDSCDHPFANRASYTAFAVIFEYKVSSSNAIGLALWVHNFYDIDQQSRLLFLYFGLRLVEMLLIQRLGPKFIHTKLYCSSIPAKHTSATGAFASRRDVVHLPIAVRLIGQGIKSTKRITKSTICEDTPFEPVPMSSSSCSCFEVWWHHKRYFNNLQVPKRNILISLMREWICATHLIRAKSRTN